MKKTLASLCLALTITGCAGTRPELGIVDGSLRPCPPSASCISSSANESNHSVAAFYFAGDSLRAWHALTDIIKQMDNAKIISQTGTYLHVEFSSTLFRSIDDSEFLLNSRANKIEIRSVSRSSFLGNSGKKKQLQKIKKLFAEQCAIAVREN